MRIRPLFTLLLMVVLATGCRGLARHTPTPAPATASATTAITLTALPTHTEVAASATATSSPRPSPTPLAQPCDHPYLPVVSGASWHYQVTGSPVGDFAFTDQVTALRASGFTLTSRIAGERYQHTWACSDAGLTAQQFDGMAAAGIALAGGQITLQTDSVEGVSLPADLAPGDQWQQEYTLSGEQFISGFGILPVSGSVQMNYTAVGFESISIPFGTFDALHINAEITYAVRVGSGLLSFSPEIYGDSEIYFVEDLGLVKVITELSLMGNEQRSIIEMTSYSFR